MLGVFKKESKQPEMSFDVEQYKKQALRILEVFDSFCSANGLRYSIAYGTMLGAIRHKGFIPWDDDVDVMMPRPDYDRFIKLTKKGLANGYKVISLYNCKNYYLKWAKIIDNNTTLIETFNHKDCILGTFIDVFPIDGLDNNIIIADKSYHSVKKILNKASIVGLNPFSSSISIRNRIKSLFYRLLGYNMNALLLKADQKSSLVPFDMANSVMDYSTINKYRAAFSPFLFNHLITVQFENINVKCLEKYDAYLLMIYGDYMKLPPIELRVSHHYHYFIDLNRRWTMEELRNEETCN